MEWNEEGGTHKKGVSTGGVLVLREKCGSEFGWGERNSTGKREVRDLLGGKRKRKT